MRKHVVLGSLLILALGACADSNPGTNNEWNIHPNSNCNATLESGIYLKSLGPVTFDVETGTSVPLKVMVIRQDDGSGGQAGPVSGVIVSYTLISVTGDAVLSAPTAQTDASGLAQITVSATEPGSYQVAAEATGTCAVTFTARYAAPLIGLEVLSPNPMTTFTNRRVSLSVMAYKAVSGVGQVPLPNRPIDFVLGAGGTGTSLQDIGATVVGGSVSALTNPAGVATIQMNTGTAAANGLTVTASLTGTAPETIVVNINAAGTGGCESNSDCPSDFPLCENPGPSGVCVENPTQSGPCDGPEDCVSPYTCQAGTCVPTTNTGTKCNPMVNPPCPPPQICVGGYCSTIPEGCTSNDDCPTGWTCVNGECVQNIPPGEEGCIENGDCEVGFVCVGGECVPESNCTNPQPEDRLQGTWHFDSTLHLREALGGFVSGLLGAFEVLRDILIGNLNIPGVPGWVEDFIESIIQGIVDAYVPPWAQEFIIAVGDISDLIDDLRVLSTVNLLAMGGYEYVGTTEWDIVEFEYRGNLIHDDPDNIDYLSNIEIEPFTSREICGVFFIDKHKVKDAVGGLVRWAIEVMLTAVTCSVEGWPCYYSIEEALEDLIDCDAIAYAIDDLVYNAFGVEVYDILYNACDGVKGPAIQYIIDKLNEIEVSFNVMTLRGVAPIQDANHLIDGDWYGTLGPSSSWDYTGEFTANK